MTSGEPFEEGLTSPMSRRYRQSLPRPEGAVVESELEARFARLGPDERARILTLEHIQSVFSDGEREANSDPVAAAVLLALVGSAGGVSIALIRRAAHLRANPGEIAFPGGRIEPGESIVEAALREAEEEVALPASAVRVVGTLPPVRRASRPDPIASVVGIVEGEPAFHANADEVDSVLLTPLATLADPAGYWEETWHRPDGTSWRMPLFHLGADVVWGASARILMSLFERLAERSPR